MRATASTNSPARPGVSPHFQHPLRSFYAGHTKGTQPPYMSQPSEKARRSWCGRLCLGRLPNRQERLFWFDRRGPEFMLFLVQMVVVLASFDIGATYVRHHASVRPVHAACSAMRAGGEAALPLC